jgi:hypothetical protein
MEDGDARFLHFALAARKRFALDNDDALRLIHEHAHRLRVVPYHLRALYAPLVPPYALLSPRPHAPRLAASHIFIMRAGGDVMLEGVLPELDSSAEYHHSATESVAVLRWREPTIVPTDAIEVLFCGEVCYRYLCTDERRSLLCFDPFLASGLSVELLKLSH